MHHPAPLSVPRLGLGLRGPFRSGALGRGLGQHFGDPGAPQEATELLVGDRFDAKIVAEDIVRDPHLARLLDHEAVCLDLGLAVHVAHIPPEELEPALTLLDVAELMEDVEEEDERLALA